MMKCQMKVAERAEAMGGSLGLDDRAMTIDAKPGYIWSATSCSIIVLQADNGQQTWWIQACKDAMNDMAMGMDLCSVDESADISNSRDEPWTAPDGSPERIT